jgi:hypothetical protein
VEKKKEIKKGQVMICKGYIPRAVHKFPDNSKKFKALYLNRQYVVQSIGETVVTLKDRYKKDKIIQISRDTFDEDFELPYCSTNHAVIGLTIKEPVTIFDWRHRKVSDRWFWTAITRNTSLKDISFYDGPDLTDEKEMLKQLKRHITKKIQGHKRYDEQNALYDEKNFVTVDWVLEELRLSHWFCAEKGCEMVRKKGDRQWSIDRLDNDLGHIAQNCRIICTSCNKGKH